MSRTLSQCLGRSEKIYLFGRTKLAKLVADTVPVHGVADDFSQGSESFFGVSVFNTDNLEREALIVNCVISANPRKAEMGLRRRGFYRVVSYGEFIPCFGKNVPLANFVREARADVGAFGEEWDKVYGCLYDEESRCVLRDILNFRLSGDYRFLNRYDTQSDIQYFDNFVTLSPGEKFADVGAYRGETTMRFLELCPSYQRIHVFEPDPDNLDAACAELAGFSNIVFHRCACSNTEGERSFQKGCGTSSGFCDHAEAQITTRRLDDVIQEPLSFIKMDIEGAEIEALQGSECQIKKNHPKLAIAAYHKISDFRNIFKLVTQFRDDYDIYLRHYTEGFSETIMYFVPSS